MKARWIAAQTRHAPIPPASETRAGHSGVTPPSSYEPSISGAIARISTTKTMSLIVPHGWPSA